MAARKKKILMSLFSSVNPANLAPISAINSSYLTKVNEFDFIPLLVSGNMAAETVHELYELSDGIIIPGGRDVNPSLYHQERHPKTKVPDDARDNLEMDIIKRSLQDGKPFLGICRGAQMLAIACGGSLMQHLPDVTDERHGRSEEETAEDPHKNIIHEVQIVPNTKAASIMNQDKFDIVSRHHQGIQAAGSLTVSGYSPAGIIELIEHPTLPFHIGIQGHIETDNSGDAFFEAFATAVNR